MLRIFTTEYFIMTFEYQIYWSHSITSKTAYEGGTSLILQYGSIIFSCMNFSIKIIQKYSLAILFYEQG